MADNLLIIHPREVDRVPDDIAALEKMLFEIGFIGDSFDFNGRPHYKPGDQFLQLITFLGCSPVVSLGEPGATGDEYCHISFSHDCTEINACHGSNTKPPRCPSCGYRDEQWRDALDKWNANKSAWLWECRECKKRYPLPAIKWRQSAGFGRFFLTIWGIFEGEAVPGERLLAKLEEESTLDWSYFYHRNP